MDFSSLGFLFSFFLSSVLPCYFWFAFNLLDGCVPSSLCPLCSVVKGSGEAALVLPALLQGKSSACFSQLLGKTKQNKTGLPMGPGGWSRATRDETLRITTHFSGCFWLIVFHQQWLAWLDYASSEPFLKRASWFPLLFNLGLVVVLRGIGGRVHKPGSRTHVLVSHGCL